VRVVDRLAVLALLHVVAIFGWVAEQELPRLIEGTKAGMERARREGKRLGRPPASPVLLHAARDLVTAGVPVAEAVRRKGISRTTAAKVRRKSFVDS
jgi:putative DNA-invertase from lambdoid prophage Rac